MSKRLEVGWVVFFTLGQNGKIGIVRGRQTDCLIVEDESGAGLYLDNELIPLFMKDEKVDMATWRNDLGFVHEVTEALEAITKDTPGLGQLRANLKGVEKTFGR